MPATHIAVLMTCHNRCDVTLKCLHALYNQDELKDVVFQVYLVDDGSTDGTAGEVKRQFPDIKIFQGNGNLYWCGGMRLAWENAMLSNYDYYLWLNDDTVLLPDAINLLLSTINETMDRNGFEHIIVGSTYDPDTGATTYGGVINVSKFRPFNFQLLNPSNEPKECDTFNGNCVLIPRSVNKILGNLSDTFTHAMGDRDYGLRAKKNGVTMLVASGYVGISRRNDAADWTKSQIPLKRRIINLYSPKGLPPKEYAVYLRRHGGILWPLYLINVYLRVLFPLVWEIKESYLNKFDGFIRSRKHQDLE